MSFLEQNIKSVPSGWRKVLHVNWALVVLICAVASVGFLMLYSVAGGSFTPWAEPQIKRFILGLCAMFFVAFVPIWFWRNMAVVGYLAGLGLLIAVELFGSKAGGAVRWIDLGFMRLQPSELMKIAVVVLLAAYYDWLPLKRTSRPLWVAIPILLVLIPVALVFKQPDLGTALLIAIGGGLVIFLAGVSLWYFGGVVALAVVLVIGVFESRDTSWQLLSNYHYDRIETFLEDTDDPLGKDYHITQAKIAMGSGGWTGKGFMQGTQSRLNFLPEKHTDFIFNILAEEFGFVGGISLLLLYMLIVVFCIFSALQNKDRFSSLMTLGIGFTFFLYFAVNMSMVMELAPVVGVPLPMVSFGGSAMLVLMLGFGLVQSAHIHRPR
ncbi:rod shape-determining protein RodA [uncultured Pelagimonas sp.]|uniref:rod shape-determining protein RodA n=1 Tax=uncultured Pelagimonas sp. TaxID=1618102 RepID=UPI0026099017|nr:rod shape-determining protein RodA [uncultured Pelagimonas sp.]